MQNREQYWFARGRKDAMWGGWMDFSGAPSDWTDADLTDARSAYGRGFDVGCEAASC